MAPFMTGETMNARSVANALTSYWGGNMATWSRIGGMLYYNRAFYDNSTLYAKGFLRYFCFQRIEAVGGIPVVVAGGIGGLVLWNIHMAANNAAFDGLCQGLESDGINGVIVLDA